jgi:hypothetical protein
MQFSPTSCHFISHQPEYSPRHPVLTLSVYVPPLMSETKFHTHTEPQRNYILYILICMFLDSSWEDKSFWTEW